MNGLTPKSSAQPANSSANSPEKVVERLDWQIGRRLDGLLQGDYRTLFYGFGVDFADLREYQPHDDVRHIDWNVTARMNSLHVRQYYEDREVSAWFLLDISRSMGFGPVDRPKELVLLELTVLFALLLSRTGNRIGAILYDGHTLTPIPPKSGRNQVLRMTRQIMSAAKNTNSSGTQLTDLLNAGFNSFKRRSLVFIISDFISEPGWEKPLALLNRRHEMIGIRLVDPTEIELPNVGTIVVEDAETGEQMLVNTADPLLRSRFKQAADRRENQLRDSLKRAAVDLTSISVQDDLLEVIVKMANLRRQFR